MSERKIIARRAALELDANSVVNLGIGMPEGVASVANEEKIIDLMTLTAEPGVIGGVPAGGLNFRRRDQRADRHRSALSVRLLRRRRPRRAFLGLAQADQQGNLNVSKFGPRLAGAGGFINISQNAKKVVFVGTFTAGRLQIAIDDGRLRIVNDGTLKKFVREVEHRTFSGSYAAEREQPVLYVTERCVFELTPEGLELIEVAPGIDIERDILARMEFKPDHPARSGRHGPSAYSRTSRWDCATTCCACRSSSASPITRSKISSSSISKDTWSAISRTSSSIRRIVETMLSPLGHKVYVIVNYDNFHIFPDIIDDYSAMVRDLVDRFYSGVTRYTTSGFLRSEAGRRAEASAPSLRTSTKARRRRRAHLRELERKDAS